MLEVEEGRSLEFKDSLVHSEFQDKDYIKKNTCLKTNKQET